MSAHFDDLRRSVVLLGAILTACGSDSLAPKAAAPDERLPLGPRYAGAGYLVTDDASNRSVSIEPPRRKSAESAAGLNFSILQGEEIGLDVSNYSVSEVGALTPGKVRIRFDVSVTNRLPGVALVPPVVGSDDAAAPALMFFPLLQSAALTTGSTEVSQDGSVVVNRASRAVVEPSVDWDGDGSGHLNGFDFTGDSACTMPAPGCTRWEALPPLPPGASSPVQTVGFDLDPTVTTFRAWLLLAADLQGDTTVVPPPPIPPEPTGNQSGIAFGEFGRDAETLGSTFTGGMLMGSPSSVMPELELTQSRGLRAIVILSGGKNQFTNPDGTFSLQLWKQQVDRFRGAGLERYIADGTIVAHYVIDEPNATGTWGGQAIPYAAVEDMARYSKTIWPELTTVARVSPQWLRGAPFKWAYLDAAWSQYTGRVRAGPVEAYRDAAVSTARSLGLGLVIGLNLLDGGDGSSGIPGTMNEPWGSRTYQMTPTEVRTYGAVLAAEPYACAMFSWRYDSVFDARSDIRGALSYVSVIAASRSKAPCRRH